MNDVSNVETRGREAASVKRNWDCKERLKNYSYMLQTCASKGNLRDGKAVHGNLITSGLEPDSHLWTCLVNMYAKCRRFESARYLLDKMPERDVVSWTALIAGFVSEGNGIEGVNTYYLMRGEGVLPNGFTFATVLKACSMCFVLEIGKQVHGEVIKMGFLSDVYVGSALVDLYAKCGEMELSKSVLSCMPEQNAISWNALLSGYARMGDGEEVLKLFNRMTESETRFSEYTLSSVLKGCAISGNLRKGQQIHSLVVKIGTKLDGFVSSALVDMYSKCGIAEDAYKVFVKIKNPDVVSWSGIISCLDQQGYNCEASELFSEMMQTGVRPNQYTVASLVCTATALNDLRYGGSIHACICKLGFESDNSVSNALVTMYMKIGSIEDGCRVFDAMIEQDLVSWNSLLSGFHDGDSCDQGPRIFSQMLVEGYKPNKYTYISILRSCSSLSNICLGQQLHGHIVKNSLSNDGFVGTALVDMYTKCGSLEDAHAVFQQMKERDVFAWTVIITGYANVNQGEKSMTYFRQMQREDVFPNESTLASCLRGCTGIAALENGRQLHSRIIKAGHSDDTFIMSALVDLYGKCGCIEEAEAVFNCLVSRDIVSWNTMICGYSQHGRGKKALDSFENMLNEGVTPDGITFIGVLSACSHVGLIEDGKKHFDSMSKVYGISPTLKHYACMVDILGRAGKLQEVETLIEKMTDTPDSLIWQTVLGACFRHGNVEFAEKAADKLFDLEPQMDATYILLSNIYAAKGRWGDVAKIRGRMSSQGVKKEPGCSWVEIDGQVHVFLPKDISHPKIKEIYQKLDEVSYKLMLAGYVPDTDSVLHDVTEREKRESLLYHSERLALAYSLISTQPAKPIRIFKNLRICRDCHVAIKLISDMTNRDIIVRDISRFHHFQNGSCSCNDYW
ncbi:Pentatricopeptide repeat [Thalictrum thalictroides]|uniref:Pentatricopeptide repeat n=1 Tax=Thalictrum thalictroides TaxID=46969 RepID=A0A7J6WF11_THATH|nr:Pentatricopeptide repeat [Thalictrum thalictroides]